MHHSNRARPHHRLLSACALILCGCPLFSILTASNATADEQLRLIQREFTSVIKPLLKQACGDCHWGKKPDAGLDLEPYESLDQLLKDRKKWKKIELRVAAHEMPPDDVDPLEDQQHKLLMDWLDKLLHSADCTDINPGHVTIRRLNRIEYQNTVRDLLGIEYEAAADFPGDDVGYGFDNIADVISLPPILMEKYLQAAEEITTQAVVDPNQPAVRKSAQIGDFKVESGASAGQGSVVLFSNSTIRYDFELPESGKYKATIRAFGDQGGSEPAKMEVLFNNRTAGKKSVRAEHDQPDDFDFELRGKTGDNQLGIAFINDEYVQGKLDRNLHVISVTIEGPIGKLPDSHRRLFPNKIPESESEQLQLARSVLEKFASRAFRRRTTPEELDRLAAMYQQAREAGDVFEIAMRFPMQAILVSPHFLYKIETPPEDDKPRFLSDFELATSLSYFLWSTMPDDELFAIAAAGNLKNGETYRQQIQRMLADDRSEALIDNFVAQWLQLRHLEDFQPDPDLFPGIDRQMRMDMIQETKLLVGELIRSDAKITDLLDADFTFVNQRLGELYGIDVKGEKFRKVSTAQAGRTGLMTHASILTLTSNPTRTSPVKRGKWILENLLGEQPPPPDPAAMQLEDQAELTGTVRERMEQHRSDPNCASCHQVMDELGFALEHYDAVGRWREKDDGQPIDALGELPDGTQFRGAEQLQTTINTKMRDQFVRCLTEKMLIYATGRGMEYFDECAIDKIVEELKTKDYRFSELIYRVATSDPFLKRRKAAEVETETE